MATSTYHERDIGALHVTTQQLSVMKALPMWVRVLNLIAPALQQLEKVDDKLIAKLKTVPDLMKADLVQVAPVLAVFGPFLERLDADVVTKLARELLVATTVVKEGGTKVELRGQDERITAALGADLGALLRILWFVGEVNFRSFSETAGEAGAGPQAASPST